MKRLASSLWRDFDQVIRHTDLRRTFWAISSSVLPDFAFARIRTGLLRLSGADLRNGSSILGRLNIVGPLGAIENLHIRTHCIIGPGVTFGLDAQISIGHQVSIGPYATLHTGSHQLGPGSRRMGASIEARPIVVEDGVWIGTHALILPGVRLGRGSVVAAGSVVMEDIPPNVLVAGNPAKVVQELPLGDR